MLWQDKKKNLKKMWNDTIKNNNLYRPHGLWLQCVWRWLQCVSRVDDLRGLPFQLSALISFFPFTFTSVWTPMFSPTSAFSHSQIWFCEFYSLSLRFSVVVSFSLALWLFFFLCAVVKLLFVQWVLNFGFFPVLFAVFHCSYGCFGYFWLVF